MGVAGFAGNVDNVTVILFEKKVSFTVQLLFIKEQLTMLLLAMDEEVKVGLFVPTKAPLTCH